MKILFVVPYPVGHSPSQRFRFEQYFNILENAGHQYNAQPFYDKAGWDALYTKGNAFAKVIALIKGFARRIALLFSLGKYDLVFIHREAAPLGPPLFEWFIAKAAGKKLVYDFDDAIWTTDKKENAIEKLIRWRSKVRTTIRWSYKVSCGNEYLANYARQFNSNVVINPTTIDTSYHKKNNKGNNDVVIGWTGSHSTLKYLDELVPAIAKLEKKHPGIRFRVIANHNPAYALQCFEFVKWSEQTEIADLSVIDIGIMPLPNDEWSKGKCGFKLLQYMALEIPSVASPVGVNTGIIKDGENGFICSNENEWIEKIGLLINDPSLRQRLGKAGRKSVEENYSVVSNSSNFLGLVELSAINTKANR